MLVITKQDQKRRIGSVPFVNCLALCRQDSQSVRPAHLY